MNETLGIATAKHTGLLSPRLFSTNDYFGGEDVSQSYFELLHDLMKCPQRSALVAHLQAMQGRWWQANLSGEGSIGQFPPLSPEKRSQLTVQLIPHPQCIVLALAFRLRNNFALMRVRRALNFWHDRGGNGQRCHHAAIPFGRGRPTEFQCAPFSELKLLLGDNYATEHATALTPQYLTP